MRPFRKSNIDPVRAMAGMSLIELCIVIAIIAILGSIAGPSLTKIVQEKRRVDAQQLLLENASRLQRCLTLIGAFNGGCNLLTDSRDGYYSLNTTLTAQTWVLTAEPVSGSPQASDTECQTITLDHTGLRSATGSSPGNCW